MWQSWSQSQSQFKWCRTPVISGRHGRQQAGAWVPQAFVFQGVVRSHTVKSTSVANLQAPTGNHDVLVQCGAVRCLLPMETGWKIEKVLSNLVPLLLSFVAEYLYPRSLPTFLG